MPKVVLRLSIIISIVAAISSGGGLFFTNIYKDNNFVKLAWYTNDIITLFFVVPLLVFSIILAKKGSVRWLLIFMGLLGFVFYNFAFYLFGAAFNNFFLLYAALVSLSGFALALLFYKIDVNSIAAKFKATTPVKWISIYLFLITAMLFFVEINMIIHFLNAGIIPKTIIQTNHPTSVVFALDFSIVIPVSMLAAILLWKRKPWGFVLSIIMLVKGFSYGLVLCIGTAVLAYSPAYGKWDSLMPLYTLLAIGGFLGSFVLIRNCKSL